MQQEHTDLLPEISSPKVTPSQKVPLETIHFKDEFINSPLGDRHTVKKGIHIGFDTQKDPLDFETARKSRQSGHEGFTVEEKKKDAELKKKNDEKVAREKVDKKLKEDQDKAEEAVKKAREAWIDAQIASSKVAPRPVVPPVPAVPVVPPVVPPPVDGTTPSPATHPPNAGATSTGTPFPQQITMDDLSNVLSMAYQYIDKKVNASVPHALRHLGQSNAAGNYLITGPDGDVTYGDGPETGAMDYSDFAFGFSQEADKITVTKGQVRHGVRSPITVASSVVTIDADQMWIYVEYAYGSGTATLQHSVTEPASDAETLRYPLHLWNWSTGPIVYLERILHLGDIIIPGVFA